MKNMGAVSLDRDQECRFHFVYSVEYPSVPLYLRISEYLIARGCRELELRQYAMKARRENKKRGIENEKDNLNN